MSLPPLVCNTPPPPEQCEDDKDPEDFDINYNLSQDDDEDSNGYDFQTYANFNMYGSSKSETMHESNWSPANSNTFDSVLTVNVAPENIKTDHITPIIKALSEKLTLDDVTVEDLNLEITQDQLIPQITNMEKSDTDSSDYSPQEIEASSNNKTAFENDIVESDMVTRQSVISKSSVTCRPETPENSSLEENIEHIETISKTYEGIEDDFDNFHSNLDTKNTGIEVEQPVVELTFENELKILENKTQPVDDFGDFDDFQFVSNDNNETTVEESFENPWDNETPQTSDFGDFKANFDDNLNDCSHVENTISENVNVNNICLENTTSEDVNNDFGDFDDFKSCARQTEDDEQEDRQLHEQVPVLDFHSPDNESQILESITKVFTSIFEEEISEPESEFIGRLETVLNETWGNLVDTDVRQPYMVNWNNSLGQKSLLKALCIDSRNILFGPKWNYNMPKYAVNLCAAPLQPQKQAPLPQADVPTSEKSTIKETDTWSDPFSSNGQEFTYAETLLLDLEHLMATLDQMAHKHSALKISELLSHACKNENETTAADKRPTDLEVFEKVISTKIDKVYPTPLHVQPLRQINLPDTHIFTPSDSETPRSKTIHYENGPPVMLTQTVNKDKNSATIISPQSSDNEVVNKLEDDNDYWEFQDFRGTSESIITSANKQTDKSDTEPEESTDANNTLKGVSVPYQPQLLQPIKVEPLMPALNWPDPGEIKETFDDFSDFVSSASMEGDKNNIATADIHENKSDAKTIALDKLNDTTYIETTSNIKSNDDDFETFQSAPPVPQTVSVKSVENNDSEVTHQPSTSKAANFDTFSRLGKCNTNEITTKVNDIFIKSAPLFSPDNHNASTSGLRDSFVINSPIHSVDSPNILQPLPASSSTSRNQNNRGQILQPLSLESYSQINWPNPGIDLQDLSRFNPVETLPSLKSDLSTGSQSKVNSPAHNEKCSVRNEIIDDDIWGDFVSSMPKPQIPTTKKLPVFGDEDEWTEFVSSSSVKPQNGLNTISLNVHTNLNMQKSTNLNKLNMKNNQISLDIPTLNYITPKSNHKTYNEKHFQNL